MNIHVRKPYKNGAGVTIQPGVYNINDPRLHNLGGYLVASGHSEVEVESTPQPTEAELDAMTKQELIDHAAAADIPITDGGLKAALLLEIKTAYGYA